MRKFSVLIALVLVIGMLMAACQPTTPATEPPVVEPVEEEPVVEEPVEEEPVVEEPVEEEPVSQNPYLGSNKLDGNGAPPTIFDDVHVRRGFAYAFDWDAVINEIYQGEAVQSKVLSLIGMPGYDPDADFYTFDLEKAAEEFMLADVDKDGIPAGEDPDDIWEMGFRLQMGYNTGNATRQTYAEILQANLAEINDKFVLEVLGLPWPAYLAAQRAHKLPIMVAGWLEDIHDAHNWYQPYTTGTYGARQNLTEDLRVQFKAFLDEGVTKVDPAERHAIYQQFNQLYFDEAVGIPVVLVTQHTYEPVYLSGRIYNPIFSGELYKTIEKSGGADPTTIVNASIGDADTLDPALSYDTASGEIIQNVYETLVYYDGIATDKFVGQLAESWEVSDDGTVWTFKLVDGVKFHEGGDLTPSDVVYSFVRGLLQGGYSSPQWLLAEPILGVGIDDITGIVDDYASADSRETLVANDPAVLTGACETVYSHFSTDDAANTVTITLAQGWGPWLATIAQGWGSIMDKEWVIENGGWNGECDTWQNTYAMVSADNPFSKIMNGTGAYKLDHWTPGEEIVLTAFDGYWGEPAKTERVAIKIVPEFGTRFAMLQAGEADYIDVDTAMRPQVDQLVGEIAIYNPETNAYDDPIPVCTVDTSLLGLARFNTEGCEEGNGQPLRLYYGRPALQQDVLIFNFFIE
ncbi:MAG: ABC transporter substrate-binding protein [Anaerolineaceae bacterium]|nr:ABC transporter substrate-binding protein [Anaerolineaceae bacterium]MDD4042856.1 ABC transporter substrate-binding protein [Anaerolineaceae bacterium]MDD4577649.1 ABC transporter substrate-binding protein [Anaerolineaceae bacterium]